MPPQDSDMALPVRDAFVIYTHILNDRIERLVERAEQDLAATHDVHVVGFFPDKTRPPQGFRSRPRHHVYRKADLLRDDYPVKGHRTPFHLRPGNNDLPLLSFAERFPEYRTFWCFEGDVEFTGLLSQLVGHFAGSTADLLTTNVRPFQQGWPHQRLIVLPPGWSREPKRDLLSFLPVYRVSRRLLERIDAFYRAGGSGHNEWSWSYVAQQHGLGIEDIGGIGPYVAAGNRQRFYTSTPRTQGLAPGTFRYRPTMHLPGSRPMTLWHPVKDAPAPPRKQLRAAITMVRELLGRS
jgi:hypothetical protein